MPDTSPDTSPDTMIDNPSADHVRRKQMLYRANHRGIKEMDILLGGFATDRIFALDAGELDQFEVLLAENDRDLLTWMTGEAEPPAEIRTAIFEAVLRHRHAAHD